MRRIKHLFHPLVALIGIQLAWVVLVIFWVYWFVVRHKEILELSQRYRPGLAGQGLDWFVLVQGLLLLGVVLAGVYIIFVYWKRQSDLVKQQKEVLAQVTHELKSPLASIQLHLETIKLRQPPPDKIDRFLDTMLSDTERLNNLISNLLITAKLERMTQNERHPVIDLSTLVETFIEKKRERLPEGGSLTGRITSGIKAAVDPESLETVLRNLFENAILYSPASPEITVELHRKGRKCVLNFKDNGRGIAKEDLKKIFRMFYRVRQQGEHIRGTGLGLYIAKSVIRENGGEIKAYSEGPGKGTLFVITLPLAE